jgi:hypothetical protein
MIFPEIKELNVSVGDTAQYYLSKLIVTISYIGSHSKAIRIHDAPDNIYDSAGFRCLPS